MANSGDTSGLTVRFSPTLIQRLIRDRVTDLFAKAWQQFPYVISRVTGRAFVDLHSTRRCKSHFSGEQYGSTGISRRADSIIRFRSDGEVWTIRESPQPSTLLVYPTDLSFASLMKYVDSLRVPASSLNVIIAGEDQTFPRQVDLRYPAGPTDAVERAQVLLNHPVVASMSVENLDSEIEGVRAIPTRILPRNRTGSTVRVVRTDLFPKPSQEKSVFVAHRVREGGQWEARRVTKRLAEGPWAGFCSTLEVEVSPPAFRRYLAAHRFTLCVEGGGLDPSPKAFEALLAGSIPIIRRTPVSEAYAELPVLILDSWTPDVLSRPLLEEFYEEAVRKWSAKWPEVLLQMSAERQWERVIKSGK